MTGKASPCSIGSTTALKVRSTKSQYHTIADVARAVSSKR
jgi:hypothetical protein